MKTRRRVTWIETLLGQTWFIIGDWEAGGWKFSRRSTVRLAWYSMNSTPDLVSKAESVCTSQDAPNGEA